MLSDHWFNPNIDVRKSGEWGRRGSRSSRRRRRRRQGVGVGIPIPFSFVISSVVNTGFQALSPANSPLASNFTSVPLLFLCFSGFLAKSFFKSESVDPLCFFTSTLRALRVDVAPLMDDSSSFSLFLFESFTGLSFFNPWVGSKEEDVSIPITIQRRSVNQRIDLDSWFLIFFHRISSFNGSWWTTWICMIPRIRNNKAEGVLDTPPTSLHCCSLPQLLFDVFSC